MQLANAIKTLTKNGFAAINSREYRKGRKIVRFSVQEGSVMTINVRSAGDNDDMVSDYSAGSYFPNLAQAIKYVATCQS
jgi:hypothetical protein